MELLMPEGAHEMTEREYVEQFREAAANYLAAGAAVGSVAPYRSPEERRWSEQKIFLSPRTAIAMCDAWLKADAAQK